MRPDGRDGPFAFLVIPYRESLLDNNLDSPLLTRISSALSAPLEKALSISAGSVPLSMSIGLNGAGRPPWAACRAPHFPPVPEPDSWILLSGPK